MRAEELFAIDVGAEVATLCSSQLQGSWQVPAELVRMAVARGAARVEITRMRGGFVLRCDGIVASRDELVDLASVLDAAASPELRQAAIARLEGGRGSVLMWAAALPGRRFKLECRSGAGAHGVEVRRGRAEVTAADDEPGVPETRVAWRCGRRDARRAVGWLRTALRFVPIPVEIDGRAVDRGFTDGLYRMRIAEPLPAELAVTASGDTPTLWLLEHGVLSARAAVPGYPAFSAAVEMAGTAAPGASVSELRSAVNPYLPRLIDEAVRMLMLLVDRLPAVDESVRRRLTVLLLRSARLGLARDRLMVLPLVPVRTTVDRRMASPAELGRTAARRGGLLHAITPGGMAFPHCDGPLIEMTAEERDLLAGLLDLRIELVGSRRFGAGLGPGLLSFVRRLWSEIRGPIGRGPVAPEKLSSGERGFVAAAAACGLDLGFVRGGGGIRRLGRRLLLGRDAPIVRAAVGAVAADGTWLYPALLAVTGDDAEIPGHLRERWIETQTVDNRELRTESCEKRTANSELRPQLTGPSSASSS